MASATITSKGQVTIPVDFAASSGWRPVTRSHFGSRTGSSFLNLQGARCCAQRECCDISLREDRQSRSSK